jgi:hypothetical protein
MARALLAESTEIDPRLGRLTLRPHQCVAVARILEIMSAHRGALLADAVGLGKTYVSLAVARQHGRVLVVCPAALRPMWTRALTAAAGTAELVSTEALSRGATPAAADLAIVDEAHHFRTPGTRRYNALADLARTARVLLLSATPLQNTRRDLTAMLAVFAGSGVARWSEDAIARLIVRRDEITAGQHLPRISGPHALSPAANDDCLDAIAGLPPAVPASDEGVAHELNTISMLHMWSSSRAALLASVRKRLARATALHDAVMAGHVPTSGELLAWRYADDSLQLALPFFARSGDTAVDRGALGAQLESFISASRALIAHCASSPDPDVARVDLVRDLRLRHPGQRIVAFSQYANTIAALGRHMRGDRGVATVTGSGAAIASGRLSREEVLAQFAVDAPRVHPVERIELLLATDLFSEGIDLRGASVVVHLDLPWNPARMEQRVGRLRRMGSAFEQIHVYTVVPPAAAERVLELERRLRVKVATAQNVIGGVNAAFAPLAQAEESQLSATERLRPIIRHWIDVPAGSDVALPPVAAASASVDGWLAVINIHGAARLIVDSGGGTTEDPRRTLSAVESLGEAMPVIPERRDVALESISAWIAARGASAGAGVEPVTTRAVLDRLAKTVARAPRHRRSATIATAHRVRLALRASTGVGSEKALDELGRSIAADDAWLDALEEFCLAGEGGVGRPPPVERDSIIALILLERVRASEDATPERSAPS